MSPSFRACRRMASLLGLISVLKPRRLAPGPFLPVRFFPLELTDGEAQELQSPHSPPNGGESVSDPVLLGFNSSPMSLTTHCYRAT